jgi:hypothetical protein
MRSQEIIEIFMFSPNCQMVTKCMYNIVQVLGIRNLLILDIQSVDVFVYPIETLVFKFGLEIPGIECVTGFLFVGGSGFGHSIFSSV